MKKLIFLIAAVLLPIGNYCKADEKQEFSVMELVDSAFSDFELLEFALNGFTFDMVSSASFIDVVNMDGDVLKMFIENTYWLVEVPQDAGSLLIIDGIYQQAIFEREDAKDILLCLAENGGNFSTATKKALLGLEYSYDEVLEPGHDGFSALDSSKKLPWADEVITAYETTVLHPKQPYIVTRDALTGEIIKKELFIDESSSFSPEQRQLWEKLHK